MSQLEITLGLSSCLAGNAVRYDGDDSFHPKIMGELAQVVQYAVFCPEMAIGLGVPRKPIQMYDRAGEIRVCGVEDRSHDVTDPLQTFARQMALQAQQWCGVILKKGSPSCGMANVRIMDAQGQQQVGSGMGMFARTLRQQQPFLPMIDEWQLADSLQYDQFIEQVFALAHWRAFVATQPDLAGLQAFHQRFALNLLLRDPQGKYDLDGWLAQQEMLDQLLLQDYFAQFMTTLAQSTDALQRSLALGVHCNALAPWVEADDLAALQSLFAQHGAGLLPLSFVLGAMRQLLARNELKVWQECNCLFPHEVEQRLRYPS